MNKYYCLSFARRYLLVMVYAFVSFMNAQGQVYANAQGVTHPSKSSESYRSLREVLHEVQERFNVSFVYEYTVVDGKEVLTPVNYKGKVENTLNRVLSPLGLRFKKINERTYSILPAALPRPVIEQKPGSTVHKESETEFLSDLPTADELLASEEQYVTTDLVVRGTVTDEAGAAIPGANVLIKGTTIGSTTDSDGKFSITVPDETAVLVISFIGYISEEVPVGNRTEINVRLTPDITQLNEIVVVGYGTQKRSSVTGAVAKVNSADVSALPVPSVESAIQGRVPGVMVTNNGSPGSTPIVRIRGIGSITGASDPLYVVDGFPQAGNISNLDTKDIESVEVLKDAAASAIYGSRAASGVILITTKSGSKDNKLHVDVDSYYGAQQAWKELDLLKRDDYIKYGTDLLTNAGNALPQRFSNMDDPIYDGTSQTYAQTETDWQDAMFRTAPITQTQVALSAGSDKSKLFTSASYFKQDGIMLGTGFERYSYRINFENKISNRFTFGQNFNVSYSTMQGENQSGGRTQLQHIIHSVPYIPVHDPTLPGGFRAPSGNDGSDPENPVRIASMDKNKTKVVNIIGAAYVEAKIINSLKYKFTFGVNYATTQVTSDNPIFFDGFAARTTHNLGDSRYTSYSPYYSNQLTFDKTFGDHMINVILVGERQDRKNTNLALSAQQSTNDIGQLIGSTNQSIGDGSLTETTLLSYLSRVNYEYKGKYLLSASIRKDGFSGFAPGNKWGNFPGLSVGWRMNEESFMQAIPSISELKLRASYGALGNYAMLGAYDFLSTIKTKTTYPFNNTNTSGAYFDQLPNAQLAWEKTDMTNFGFDLGLFENRFTFSAEYFVRNTESLILGVLPAPSLGYSSSTQTNIAGMKNRGFEFSAGYSKAIGALTFTATGNLAILRNTVDYLETPTSYKYAGLNNDFGGFEITRTAAGRSIQEFYGYVTDGIFQSQAEIDAANAVDGDPASKYQAKAEPGDIRFKDLDGNGTIDSNDQKGIGSYLPNYTYGLNLSAKYNSFDLTFFIQGVQGNEIYNGVKVLGQGMLRLFGAQTDVLNAWTEQNPNTDVPRAVNGDPNQNSRTSNRFVEDGSYLRMKSINIGYTLPADMLQKATGSTIKRLRVYVSAQNLFTITNYTGYDPEIGNRYNNTAGNTLINGIDYGQFPSPRTFLGGLQIGF